MTVPEFPALVSQEGRLQFTAFNRQAMDGYLATLRMKQVLVRIFEDGSKLSERQRKWYFSQVLGRITGHTGQPKEELHAYFKDLYLGSPEHKLLVIVDADGTVIDERDVLDRPSITALGTKAMARYCDQIREFAALKLNLDIPNPDRQWRSIA